MYAFGKRFNQKRLAFKGIHFLMHFLGIKLMTLTPCSTVVILIILMYYLFIIMSLLLCYCKIINKYKCNKIYCIQIYKMYHLLYIKIYIYKKNNI